MTNLFRNSSPGALTREQAVTLEKKRLAERRRQARELAARGRGEDTEIAHVALGELVVPQALQTPELLAALRLAAADQGIPVEMLRIGSAKNQINPNTGAPEFGAFDDVTLEPLPHIELPPQFQNQGLPREVAKTLPHRVDMISAMQNPRVQAGLDLIRNREGGAVDIWTGGQRYPMPTPNSGHPGSNRGGQSAAGIFQLQEGTFNDMQKRVGPMDFQEPDQHLAATAYLDNLKALEPLRNGDIDQFLRNASTSAGWASLPEGKQDRGITTDQAKALYEQFLRNRMER